MSNVQAHVQSGALSDPLAANYVLVDNNSLVTAFQGPGNRVEILTFACSAASLSTLINPTTMELTSSTFVGSTNDRKHVAMAAGDFNGDGLQEVAIAYDEGGQVTLQVLRPEPGATNPPVPQVTLGAIGTSRIYVGTGSFGAAYAGSGRAIAPKPLLVVAWADPTNRTLILQLWDAENHAAPVRLAKTADLTLSEALLFDVAIDDINGDGLDEIVVTFQGAADPHNNNNDLYLSVFAVSTTTPQIPSIPSGQAGMKLVSTQSVDQLTSTQPQLSITTGYFVAGQNYDVALAWAGSDHQAHLALYHVDALGKPLSPKDSWVASDYPLDLHDVNNIVRVTAGDLDIDGLDEIVLGTQGAVNGSAGYLILRLFQVNNAGTLERKDTACFRGGGGTYDLLSIDLQLTVGSVQNTTQSLGIVNALIVAAVGLDRGLGGSSDKARLSVGFVSISQDLTFAGKVSGDGLRTLDGAVSFDGPQAQQLDITIGLGLADFQGTSTRVGAPTVFNLAGTNNPILVINAAPYECTWQSGQGTANNSVASGILPESVSNTNNTIQTTSISYQHLADFAGSDQLSESLGFNGMAKLSDSVTNTYGHGFTQTLQNQAAHNMTTTFVVNQDDGLVIHQLKYTVWEYPVYNAPGDSPAGHLLVVFPGSDVTEKAFGGTDFDSHFAPGHQVGRILSYPITKQDIPEIGSVISELTAAEVGTIQVTCTVGLSTSSGDEKQTSDSSSTSVTTGIDFSDTEVVDLAEFELGSLSTSIDISASTTGTYTKSSMNTQQVSVTSDLSFTAEYPKYPDNNMSFTVQPLLYWSTLGYMVLDWLVSDPIAIDGIGGTGQYWLDNYGTAKLTFRQPFNAIPLVATDPPASFYPNGQGWDGFTRSITFVEQGGDVRANALISNYGLVAATNVAYTFQLETFSADGTGTLQPLGAPGTSITRIAPRASVAVESDPLPKAALTQLHATKGLRVHCWVQPGPVAPEGIQTWAAHGWAIYPSYLNPINEVSDQTTSPPPSPPASS
jgi:hypothetical protein